MLIPPVPRTSEARTVPGPQPPDVPTQRPASPPSFAPSSPLVPSSALVPPPPPRDTSTGGQEQEPVADVMSNPRYRGRLADAEAEDAADPSGSRRRRRNTSASDDVDAPPMKWVGDTDTPAVPVQRAAPAPPQPADPTPEKESTDTGAHSTGRSVAEILAGLAVESGRGR